MLVETKAWLKQSSDFNILHTLRFLIQATTLGERLNGNILALHSQIAAK